jgi:hypothetical protein
MEKKKKEKWHYIRREVIFTILPPPNPEMKKAIQVFKWCPLCDAFHVP